MTFHLHVYRTRFDVGGVRYRECRCGRRNVFVEVRKGAVPVDSDWLKGIAEPWTSDRWLKPPLVTPDPQ